MRGRLLTADNFTPATNTLHGIDEFHRSPFVAYAEVDSSLLRAVMLSAEAADGPDDGLVAVIHRWEVPSVNARGARIRVLDCPVVLPPGRWQLRLLLDDRTLDRRWVEVRD